MIKTTTQTINHIYDVQLKVSRLAQHSVHLYSHL